MKRSDIISCRKLQERSGGSKILYIREYTYLRKDTSLSVIFGEWLSLEESGMVIDTTT